MNYPLELSFKILAFSPQILVTDATGETVFYVKQKLFKLKEAVNVFEDKAQTTLYCTIKADRILDFNASYTFATPAGRAVGSVRRKGMSSIWSAKYDIYDGKYQVLRLTETNPWAKIGDALFCEIPVVGLFAGYVFHPIYAINDMNENTVLRCEKLPAMWEGKFRISKVADMDEADEARAVLSFLMMLLLERRRG